MIDFADLARPTGYSGSLKEVFDRQNRRVVRDFIASFRVLEEESPQIVEESGFSEYFEQLSKLSGTTVAWLFSLPITAFWCDVLQKLILRKAHRNLSAGHPIAHLREFGRFVLAAYVFEGRPAEIRVRLDKNSRLYLPGLIGAVLCPKELLLTDLVVRLDGEHISFSAFGGRQATLKRSWVLETNPKRGATLSRLHDGLSYRFLPTADGLFEISNGDSYLRLPERVFYSFESMTKPVEDRWVSSVEQAWDVVRTSDPLVADEIASVVQVIVPVVSDSPDIHLSSSFAELPRGFYMSWHTDPLVLAEAIVHEYHHVKLNAILEIDPLLTGSTQEEIFYSPWRDDPRPLSGLLHAVYAFSGVTRFWIAYLDGLGSESRAADGDWVPSRIVKSVLQLEYAVNSLRQKTGLSEAGNLLVDSLAQEAMEMKNRLPSLPANEEAFVHRSVEEHYENWKRRHQGLSDAQTPAHYRQSEAECLSREYQREALVEGCMGLTSSDNPDVTLLVDQDCVVSEVASRALGYQVQFPVNRIAEGVHQKDQLMDDLFTLLTAEGTPGYDSVRECVFAHPNIKSPFCTYLRGICCYIEGDYRTSAEYLIDAISVQPDNVDLWRYFGFALRHSGYQAACKSIFFHLPLCITHAQGHLISSDSKRYEGWQCQECAALVARTIPTEHVKCPMCNGTSLTKVTIDIPVFSRFEMDHIAIELEQVGKVS